jgi:hypothetical protein
MSLESWLHRSENLASRSKSGGPIVGAFTKAACFCSLHFDLKANREVGDPKAFRNPRASLGLSSFFLRLGAFLDALEFATGH